MDAQGERDWPRDEANRLDALRRYAILDSLPEPAFDDIVFLAAKICETPVALISLVDANRQWFKAKVGLAITETSREVSFCSHAIEHDDLLIVPDASEDDRFKANPLVTTEPKIRFYAGAPLVTPAGHALGTLCVVDYVPRQLAPELLEALRALSRQVVAQLELRRTLLTDHASMASQNAQMFAREQVARGKAELAGRRFEALTRLAQAVTWSLDLQEALSRVARAAIDLLPDSASRIWVAEENELRLRSQAGTVSPVGAGQTTRLALGEGLAGHAAATRQPLVVENVLADSRTVNVEWIRQEGYRSLVSVPLVLSVT